jgi:hypothetical protein
MSRKAKRDAIHRVGLGPMNVRLLIKFQDMRARIEPHNRYFVSRSPPRRMQALTLSLGCGSRFHWRCTSMGLQ